MKKTVFRILATFVCTALLLCMCLPVAAGGSEASGKADLTVTLAPDGKPVADAQFRLYRIAEVPSTEKITLVSPYSSFSITAGTLSSNELRTLATTLEGVVLSRDIDPDYIAETDANGKAEFKDIATGIYLVLGSEAENKETEYFAEPFIVCVPSEDENANKIYRVEVVAKVSGGGLEQKNDIRVIKIWKDDDSTSRPKEIYVRLYKGGTPIETVVLNADNNWKHEWKGFPEGNWTVVEEVPDGYTVSVQREGHSFIITNTISDEHGKTENSTSETKQENDKLPHTGMLWWPVPLLAFSGLMLFVFGWRMSRRNEDE